MQENRQGVILVIVAMTIFSVQDVIIKFLSDDISLFQVLFCRSSIGAVLIAAYLKFSGQRLQFGSAYPLLSIFRGLLFFLGYSAFYFGQSKVPIANATVLFLISPFFITILSIFAFGSLVGYSRWITMIIGFSGVILIARPELGAFNPFYLFPIMSAVMYSVSMIIAKITSEKDTVYQQILFMYMVTALLSGAMGLAIGDGGFDTAEFESIQFMTRAWNFDGLLINTGIVAISMIGTLAYLLLTTAYRISDPAKITPFEYSGLLASIVCGYLFWSDVPSTGEAIGMALIVGSGMFLYYREHLRGQAVAAETPLR
ncbi:MAG TPA: DMT family transporter [Gammaproteobacteria bacterium]|nr:DMT family transporter [Gammaproteobacteria bacterium]